MKDKLTISFYRCNHCSNSGLCTPGSVNQPSGAILRYSADIYLCGQPTKVSDPRKIECNSKQIVPVEDLHSLLF